MRKQPTEELQPFALELIRLRGEAGLSMRKLSERTGISPKSIVALEHARQRPTAPTLAKLAKGLGVPTQQLVEVLRSYPFDVRPRLAQHVLEAAGVHTSWSLTPLDELDAQAEKMGHQELREQLIHRGLRAEQRAYREAAADPTQPPAAREYLADLDEECGLRMLDLLTEARRRERSAKRRRQLVDDQREILADAG